MGIEPKRSVLQNLKNDAFCESPTAACDWRANFRVMTGKLGLRETTTGVCILLAATQDRARNADTYANRPSSTLPRI